MKLNIGVCPSITKHKEGQVSVKYNVGVVSDNMFIFSMQRCDILTS